MVGVLSMTGGMSRKKSSSRGSEASFSGDSGTVGSSLAPAGVFEPRRTPLAGSSSEHSSSDRSELIHALLKRYKKLEIVLPRFNSKTNSTQKTNILRKNVLPFLRSLHKYDDTLVSDIKTYKSFTSVSSAVLLKWWRSLLNCINHQASAPNLQVVSSNDRNAYLECISRIIERQDWRYVDADIELSFQSLLSATLEYSIHKLQTLKAVSLAMSAFIGKIFAYSFFYLDNVSTILLFLLNVKQSMLESISLQFGHNLAEEENRPLIESCFPSRIKHLINYKGLDHLSRKQKVFVNAIAPPKKPVKGIRGPNEFWVRRWCSRDSDVFYSFFRHYIGILGAYVKDKMVVSHGVLLLCPGFSVIFGHVHQIFNIAFLGLTKASVGNVPLALGGPMGSRDKNMKASVYNANPMKPHEVYYDAILKFFRVMRHISFLDVTLGPELVYFVNEILINMAKSTPVYDYNMTGFIFNLVHEYVYYVGDEIDWGFWLSCIYTSVNQTDHIQTLLKSFAFLFNIWDMIPDRSFPDTSKYPASWMKRADESLKMNFIYWLISEDVWERFFVHWHPIVRSYYLRLVIWRVIGFEGLNPQSSNKLVEIIDTRLKKSYRKLTDLSKNFKREELNFRPDSPLANRKFGILTNTNQEDVLIFGESDVTGFSKPSQIRKTHPYEIFDEAIYSCSSLPVSPSLNGRRNENLPNENRQVRNNSLVSSIGKLFKILSTDDKKEDDFQNQTHGVQKKSASCTSLSTTFSSKSDSSSPSVSSYRSTPTSFTDLSTDSSLKSDSDSWSMRSRVLDPLDLRETKPPEIYKMPPDIKRPLYKFSIVVDHESMNRKLYITNSKGGFIGKRSLASNILKMPLFPLASFLLDVDPRNERYILDLSISEDDYTKEVEFNPKQRPNIESMKLSHITNLGKSLNEWNLICTELDKYLSELMVSDKFDSILHADDSSASILLGDSMVAMDTLKSYTPFMPVDNSTEIKFLNAG